MKNFKSKDLGKIAGLAALGFILWLGILFVLWVILRSLGFTTSSWAMVEALSTALTGATIATGGFVAYRELSEAEKSRHIDIADRLFDELNSEENIQARRWVYWKMPDEPKQWTANPNDEGDAAIKRVLNSLDRVSFLTQEGWIPDDIIMPWMHPMIAKSWEKLESYVKYERERRKEPYFYLYAEKVAERCRSWRSKNELDKPTQWIDKPL